MTEGSFTYDILKILRQSVHKLAPLADYIFNTINYLILHIFSQNRMQNTQMIVQISL